MVEPPPGPAAAAGLAPTDIRRVGVLVDAAGSPQMVAVAAPSAVKPTPTPAELAAAAAPVKLASGAEADFAAQCVAVHKSNFRGACFMTD